MCVLMIANFRYYERFNMKERICIMHFDNDTHTEMVYVIKYLVAELCENWKSVLARLLRAYPVNADPHYM